MKILGIVLMIAGIIWALAAFNLEPAAIAPTYSLGSGHHTVETPALTVHDIGIVDRRRDSLVFARLTILVGALFVCFGSLRKRAEAAADRKRCPHCAELIRREAAVCKHCGRDVATPRAKPRQAAVEVEPGIPETADQGDLAWLCNRLKRNALSYEQYRQLAAAADASLVVLTGFTGADYIVTRGQEKLRFKSFEALRPWFLENIVPKIQRDA